MFSVPQYTSTELQPYNYFVMQEPVFEEKIEEPVFTCVYEEKGVLYCASSTSKRGYYYTYCLNNPLIYTDPDGESIALAIVFAVWGAWNVGVHAGAAAEESGGDFWRDGFWKGAIVGGVAGALGGSGISPLGTEWLGTTLWGAGLGTATQAGTIWAMGGDDYSQIWQGALIGGAMGFMASEQFGNWTGGKGFYSNDQVLKNFEAGKYDITGFDTWQDAALDHFGFEGKYDPSNKGFGVGGDPGITNRNTGEIFYNETAFDDGYDKLYFTAHHESIHSAEVLSGKYKDIEWSTTIEAKEEFLVYKRNYFNQGLYPNHGIDLASYLNVYGGAGGVDIDQVLRFSFDSPKWHNIFKIPRLW